MIAPVDLDDDEEDMVPVKPKRPQSANFVGNARTPTVTRWLTPARLKAAFDDLGLGWVEAHPVR